MRIASYLVVITLRKVIIAGVLDFTMAASHFLKVIQEVISAVEEISFLNSTKDASKFGVPLFKRKI